MALNKNVQILSIEGKDLLTKKYKVNKNSLYKASLDDSIEVDKLKELNKKIIKFNKKKKRFYSEDIITVTFKYSAKKTDNDYSDEEFERIENLKLAYNVVMEEENDSNKDILKDIKETVKIAEKNINQKEIREQLYHYGFNITINGKLKHFVRYKRSGGSARVGKCLFINENYYKKMIDWSFAGIKHKPNTEMDCSSMEAYIALSTSTCIDRFKLKPENILLIDDITSTFTDTVMATKLINEEKDKYGNIINGDLYTDIETTKITNKIIDGESLLDKSIFEECGYGDKAILQIRNRFFKGIGVNTDIQGFFKDNNITKIEQLNGKTIATDISQIKLITTPSSVKYLKYGTFEKWLTQIVENWGICKYEKPQHHFNGMVQTHYQLINTLGMSKEETELFLEDTIRYIDYLKNDTTVFKYHLGLLVNEDEELREVDSINNNAEFILEMLKRNDDFIHTKMCSNFRNEIIKSYIKNARKGHILVNGNYSVVISCPYEFLLASINKWNGKSSILKPFECVCSKFEENKEILGVRSPQPTMSNMCKFINRKSEILNKYFNTNSQEVIFISSIDNNVFELQSSMDVDGDAMLLTDNKYLVNALKRLNEEVTIYSKKIPRFLIPTDFTPKASIKRKYNWKDLADVDIKCSSNKIGEIINLAQMLNSIYWDKKSNNAPEEELFELYKDICQLDILSCIEIDRCKKLSPVNAKKELDRIRKKNYLDKGYIIRNKQPKEVGIRPYFFKFLEGGKDYKFKKFNCGMDNLEIILDEKVKYKKYIKKYTNFTDIITKHSHRLTDRKKLLRLKNTIIEFNKMISYIHNSNIKNKWELYETIHNKYLEYIKSTNITPDIIYAVLYRISKANEIEMFKEYKKIGKSFLNMLYEANKKVFLNYILENKENDSLIEDNDGKIDLYGLKFNKILNNTYLGREEK